MKVALVYPRFRYYEYNGLAEPLGVLHLYTELRQAGHQPVYVDYSFCKEIHELDHLVKDAGLVGVAISAAAKVGASQQVIDHLRTINPKATYIAGGAYPSIFPEKCLNETKIDYVLEGECEEAIVELAELLQQGKDPRGMMNLSYRKNGAFVQNPRRPVPKDLNAIAFPAREQLDYDSYVAGGMAEYGMVSTRGCPFNCLYCKPSTDKIYGGGIRFRSAENVVGEILELAKLRRLDCVPLFFKDDTITMHPTSWFEEFRDRMKASGVKLKWHCNSRVDTLTRGKVQAMAENGCHCISFGIESGSQRILDFYQKRTTPEQAIRAFKWCHEVGIEATSNIMIGCPMETLDDIAATYKLLKKLKPDDIIVYLSTAIPCRYIYDWAKENGYLANDTNPELLDPARNRAHEVMNMHLPNFTLEQVIAWKHKIERYRAWRKMTSPDNLRKWFKDLGGDPLGAAKKAARVLRGFGGRAD